MTRLEDNNIQERKKVVVTGAAGFVGSHLVERLSTDPQVEVIATDSPNAPQLVALRDSGIAEVRATDLRDAGALTELVASAHTVVHLAAVRTKASAHNPRAAHEVNVGATYDLLTAARDAGVRRFLLGSSHTVYGSFQEPTRLPFREDQPWPCRGINMYAATKLAGEAYGEAFAVAGGPEFSALRLGTIYGPHASPGSNGSLMADVLTALAEGKRVEVPWASSARHALIHVDDVTEAIRLAVHVGELGYPINVVGDSLASREIYGRLVEVAGGSPDSIHWDESRTRYQLVSRDRMAQTLGFEPQVTLQSGIQSIIDWFESER